MLKDAPDGWEASSNTRLSLGKFLSMCADLSDTNNQVSPGSVVSQNFEKYSGYSYTPENVRLAFEQKILYSREYLINKYATKQQSQKWKCKGICSKHMDKFVKDNPS